LAAHLCRGIRRVVSGLGGVEGHGAIRFVFAFTCRARGSSCHAPVG
jgi:hypothetical protein